MDKKRGGDTKQLREQHLRLLRALRYPSGLFAAAKKTVSTGYDRSWLRDNFYTCLAFEQIGDFSTVRSCYKAILTILLKHEYKIDYAIAKKPLHRHEYIHARFHPETFDEFWEEWGNKQNDAIGAILFGLGRLQTKHHVPILETPDECRIVQKLVYYLASLEYWHDPDSGVWEEHEEVHASSVGACVAGLLSVSKIRGIDVPGWLIQEGQLALKSLLPRESERYAFDVAQLSLIWPYDVVDRREARSIIERVTYFLERRRGTIRHKEDYYYNADSDGYSQEAEWPFGLFWLAIIYHQFKDKAKEREYVERSLDLLTKGGIPELYYANSSKHNENRPLGWAESLFVVMLDLCCKKKQPRTRLRKAGARHRTQAARKR